MVNYIVDFLLHYGLIGIFVIAVMEAIFLPVPVETLLIPFAVLNPKMIILAIIVSTLGSVIGAGIGNKLGKYGEKHIVSKIINKNKIDISRKYFAKFGVWAIGIAAITPLPYKLFALISGVVGMGLGKVMTVSFMARGTRFSVVCLWAVYFGVNIF